MARAGRVAIALAVFSALTFMPAVDAPAALGKRAAIARLLDERADAIRNGDRRAFMATLAPDSGDFVARQKAFFERIQTLPLASYRLTAVWEAFGDLVRPSDRARYPDAEAVSIPLTEERYRIRGFDPVDAVEDMYLTFVRRDGEWLIAEDTDLDDLTLYSGRHLWDLGPVEQARRGHLLQLSHPCPDQSSCPATAHDYLGLAEIALERVEGLWSAPWDRDIVLLIPDDQNELRRLIQATFDLEDFVAFAYASVDVEDGIEYTGHRMIVNPAAFSGRAEETVIAILAHEMLHVAARHVSGPFVPFFVDEGIAEYVGRAGSRSLGALDAEVAAGRFDGRLPEDFEFTIGSGTDIYRSYQESQSAVRFFISRFGLPDFIRFYRRLGSRKIEPGTAAYHLSTTLEDVTGLDLDAFEKAWADSIG